MAREETPLYIPDLSTFARALRAGLKKRGDQPGQTPSHQEMLGLIAQASGHRNYQALRAETPPPPERDRAAERALRVFDRQGRMTRWPAQTGTQALCLWVVWHRLPAGRDLSEPQVNAILRDANSFGDHVQLRRSLIEHNLVTRARDGSIYRRVEQRPPDSARAVLRAVLDR